jgi:hypothetical protein
MTDRTTMEGLVEWYLPRVQQVWKGLEIDSETLKIGSIAAIVSVIALYVGYLYILSLAEAPVTFNVPLPEQLQADWEGTNWDDIKGEEKKILEDQVQGVSRILSTLGWCRADGNLIEMEHGAHRELLPGGRTDTIHKHTPCDARDCRQGRSRRETGAG